MKYVVSVSKKASQVAKRRPENAATWHKRHLKRHWVLYGYDEDGVFRTERVKWYTAYWFRLSKKKVKVKYDK